MRRVILLILMLTSVRLAARERLYEDPSGWGIHKAISGPDVLSLYNFTQERAQVAQAAGKLFMSPAQLPYLLSHGPGYYYLFALMVPEGMVLRWSAQSMLTLTYTCGRDTLTLTSTELFFATNRQPSRLIFTYALEGTFLVPNPIMPLYSEQTWKDKETGIEYMLPGVFAKFPFEDTPDRILGCAVTGVEAFTTGR